MAMFRGITAEEEAATGLIYVLASDSNRYIRIDRSMVSDWFPFVSSAVKGICTVAEEVTGWFLGQQPPPNKVLQLTNEVYAN